MKSNNETEDLFNKIESMPMPDLLRLCAMSLDKKMDDKRVDALFMILEMRLQKARLLIRLGMKESK